jgi:hypothetical protein
MKPPFKRQLSFSLQPSASGHISRARRRDDYGRPRGGADHDAFNEQVDYLLEAYKDPAKITDPLISEVFVANSLRRMLDVLLRVSAERGVPFISISRRDFFGYGGAQVNQWPAAWDITKRLSFGGGCGNGPQSQVFDYFYSHPELWGTYDTETGEKVGPHLTLYSADRRAVDKPIPKARFRISRSASTGWMQNITADTQR